VLVPGLTRGRATVWSNFEIADMDFWRGEAYQAFFDFLESKGGFYYERWGDAPVHSIAVALFVPRDRLHFFTDVGYRHTPFQHCPQGPEWEQNKCSCNKMETLGACAACVQLQACALADSYDMIRRQFPAIVHSAVPEAVPVRQKRKVQRPYAWVIFIYS
jgi:hypothetical protein